MANLQKADGFSLFTNEVNAYCLEPASMSRVADKKCVTDYLKSLLLYNAFKEFVKSVWKESILLYESLYGKDDIKNAKPHQPSAAFTKSFYGLAPRIAKVCQSCALFVCQSGWFTLEFIVSCIVNFLKKSIMLVAIPDAQMQEIRFPILQNAGTDFDSERVLAWACCSLYSCKCKNNEYLQDLISTCFVMNARNLIIKFNCTGLSEYMKNRDQGKFIYFISLFNCI